MEIRNSIMLHDAMSPVLNKVMTSLRYTLAIMRSTSGESLLFKQAEKDIATAQQELDKFNIKLKDVKENMKGSLGGGGGGRGRLPIETPKTIFSNAAMPLTEAWAGLELVKSAYDTFKGALNFGDSLLSNEARIKNMNDGLMTTKEIQDLIFQSAQRSRAEYMATANAVTRMGILAGSAFQDMNGKLNIAELIKFNELVNKTFVIGGSTAMEQKYALYQLTQAMASGRLQGDEMRTIREAAPLLRNAIRDYMKVDEATFKEYQKEGKITSEVIKNAVFASQKQIESEFNNMEITGAQAMTIVGNVFTMSMSEAGKSVSRGIVSTLQWVTQNIEIVGAALSYVSTVLLLIFARNMYTALIRSMPILTTMVLNFWALNGPIVAATFAVFTLLAILMRFPQVMGYIVGGVYAFGTAFKNVIFGIIDYFAFMINEIVIKGINKVLEGLGKTKITPFEYLQLSSVSDSFDKGYEKGYQLMKDFNKEVDTFITPVKNVFNSITSPTGKTGTNNIDNIDNVNNIKGGKISLDDNSIKWIQEEAAIEFVNRYTTLRPVLNVQFGDVHETANVEQIVDDLVTIIQDAYKTGLEDES